MTGAQSHSDHYQSKIYIKLKGARSITKQSQLSACCGIRLLLTSLCVDVSSQVEPHRQQTRELTALSNIDNLTEDVFDVFFSCL